LVSIGCLLASSNAFTPFTTTPQQQRIALFGATKKDGQEFLEDESSNKGISKPSTPLIDCGAWWRSTTVVVAGLTLAGQVAGASLLPAPEELLLPQQQDGIAHLQQSPSNMLAAATEIMDFSLPSYDDSIKGAELKTKSSDTSFNPFGDFEPKKVEDIAKAEEEAKKAEAKAAAADEKAAEEAKKAEAKKAAAEERAAEEAKKAEAKKKAAEERAAEIARRAEEREAKQKAAEEEREAKRQAAAAAKEASSSTSEAESPSFEIPDFKAPDISLPAFKAPDFKKPDFDIPKVEVPKLEIPKVDIPKIAVPKVDVSGVDAPKIDIPKFDSSSLPSISLPKVGGGEGAKVDLNLDPQDVRDERARAARQTYLASDETAKEAEAAARAAREAANEKLKLSRAAKDEACKTRPGGTLICLRNPFSTGF